MMAVSAKTCLLSLIVFLALSAARERGFVYCPAYPCTCESIEGALSINCRNLYLSVLPKFLSFNGRIKELSLRDNSIRSLPSHGFRGLHIEKLNLLENAVTSVHREAFTGLENSLMSLSIQLYAFNGLPSYALSQLKHLSSLVIVGCKQLELTSDLFLNLTALNELHLIGCRIFGIKPGAFRPLPKLHTLILTHNSLRHHHIAEINLLSKLTYLDLSSNNIHLLDNLSFSSLSKLQTLKLALNKLTYIAWKAFYNLDFSLKDLDLHGNNIKEQALESFKHLKILQRLDLSFNNISNLSKEYFTKMRYLSTLLIAFNDINIIERRSFAGIGMSLSELDLHGNPLEMIERGTFSEFSRLQKLNINSTRIGGSFLQDSFLGLESSLKYLDASKSNLVSSDIKTLSKLSNITHVDLSKNRLTDIKFTLLKSWSQLKMANFSFNNISNFLRGNVTVLNSTLTLLDLSWNNISVIQECAFFIFRHLVDVRLEGNPIKCTCELSWLIGWLRVTHSQQNQLGYQWLCHSPQYLKGTSLAELTYTDLTCPQSTMNQDKCLALYDKPWVTNEAMTTVATLHSNRDMTCGPICLIISTASPVLLHIQWHVEARKDIVGYNVIVRRRNDSFEIESIVIPTSISNYTFSIDPTLVLDVCLEALSKTLVPLLTKCQEVVEFRESRIDSKQKILQNLMHNSFLPLLLIYISGSLACAFLVACIIICVRRRQKEKPQERKPYYLAYPAWLDHRSSVSSSPMTHDAHFLNTLFADDVSVIPRNISSTQGPWFEDRLGMNAYYPDATLPCDSTSMPPSRRGSRSNHSQRICGYSCNTFSSHPHLAMEILASRPEVDNEFFFHF